MKKRQKRITIAKRDVIVFTTAAVILGVSLYYQFTRPAPVADTECRAVGVAHTATLKDDAIAPATIAVNRCDRITFINQDNREYRLALGVHDLHVSYPGFYETTLASGQTLDFIAVQSGTYQVHDHLRDKAKAQLLIAE